MHLADLLEQGFGNHAMEWHDRGEIGAPEQVVGEDEGGRGHFPAAVRRENIHDDAEIQVMIVEPCDQPLRRLAENRKHPDHPFGLRFALGGGFQAEWRNDLVTQIEQRLYSAGALGKYPLGSPARIERRVRDRDAKSVRELRARQHALTIDIGFNFKDGHRRAKSCAPRGNNARHQLALKYCWFRE